MDEKQPNTYCTCGKPLLMATIGRYHPCTCREELVNEHIKALIKKLGVNDDEQEKPSVRNANYVEDSTLRNANYRP